MRYGLKRLVLMVGVAGMFLGLWAQQRYFPKFGLQRGSARTSGGAFYDLTIVYRYDNLDYCVARPSSFDSGGWRNGRRGPSSDKSFVEVCGNGLFVDKKRIAMDSHVYVYTIDRTMRPIELTDEEYAQLRKDMAPIASRGPLSAAPMVSTPVWRTKVEPVLDEEYQRGPTAVRLRNSEIGR